MQGLSPLKSVPNFFSALSPGRHFMWAYDVLLSETEANGKTIEEERDESKIGHTLYNFINV